MIDEDDAWFATVLAPLSWLGLVVVVIVWHFACQNKDECAHRHCPTGAPQLIKGQCLCVIEAQ